MLNSNLYINKILNKPIINLTNEIINSVHFLSPIKNDFYKRNIKYSIKDYVMGIIDVLKNYTSWNSYNGFMNGNTLRKKHNEWTKLGVYEYTYKQSLKKLFKVKPVTEELKNQSIDSTFVEDKNGSKFSSFNGLYKCKKGSSSKGIKITSLVTTSGIPLIFL